MALISNNWRILALIVVLFEDFDQGQSHKIDSLGRKFVFALPTPYKPSSVSGTYRPNFYAIISTPSEQLIRGNFHCPGVAWDLGFTSTFANPANITIAATDYLGYSYSATPKPITIDADGDVAVHAFYSYSNFNSEWLMGSANVMPIDALGSEYYIASYMPYSTRKSELTVTSLDNETTVDIRTTNGERYTEILAPYSTYQLQSTVDLTGSMVKADNRVSVMSGSSCAKVPARKDRCNYLFVHLTDVKSAGTQFILSPFKDRDDGYVFRVIGTVDNTVLRMYPGNLSVEIHAREFYEMDVISNIVMYVTTTAAALVFQYGKGGDSGNTQGDPLMVVVPAIEHFVHTVTFPVAYLPTRRATSYSISVIVRCQFVEGLLLDGGDLGQTDTLVSHGSDFCAVRAPITLGTHTVSHTSPQALLSVLLHAISYKIGYAYQGGYNVKGPPISTDGEDTTFLIPDYFGVDGLSLLCQETQMVVFVNKTMLVDGKASDVHFNDPRCVGQLVGDGKVIQVVAENDACGTMVEESNSGTVYTNRLLYEGPRERGTIMRDPTFNIPVTCKQNDLQLVSLALSPQTREVNETLERNEKLLNVTYTFKMYRNKKYNVAYTNNEYPVSVELGQPLYFEASVSGAEDLQILTKRCVTTETSDPLATPNYIFVDDGCAPDPTVTFYETNEDTKQRFSVLTFGFFPDTDKADQGLKNTAYVHCWLLVCNSSDSSSRCILDCSDKSKRDTLMRQSAKDLGSKQIRISHGPIILVREEPRGATSTRSSIAPALGGTLSVLGIVCIIILVVAIIKAKRRRGTFSLMATQENDNDTVQLIDMSPPSSPF